MYSTVEKVARKYTCTVHCILFGSFKTSFNDSFVASVAEPAPKPFKGIVSRGARSTLEQIPPREILLLEEIPGKSAHDLAPFLKSSL
jgi:hypothetical protein